MPVSELYTLPIRYRGAGPVHVIAGSLDATTDITLYTPNDPNNSVFLVGQFFDETVANNLAYKSGSTTIVTLELAASQLVNVDMKAGVQLGTAPGQALIVNASAGITSAVFHVIEAKYLVFQ